MSFSEVPASSVFVGRSFISSMAWATDLTDKFSILLLNYFAACVVFN